MMDAPISFIDRLIATSGHLVHKIRATDSTGRPAYYFVYVRKNREDAFLTVIESGKNMDLDDFGQVLISSYGEEPSDAVKAYLKQRYNFDV
jgi:hypothetical protein